MDSFSLYNSASGIANSPIGRVVFPPVDFGGERRSVVMTRRANLPAEHREVSAMSLVRTPAEFCYLPRTLRDCLPHMPLDMRRFDALCGAGVAMA